MFWIVCWGWEIRGGLWWVDYYLRHDVSDPSRRLSGSIPSLDDRSVTLHRKRQESWFFGERNGIPSQASVTKGWELLPSTWLQLLLRVNQQSWWSIWVVELSPALQSSLKYSARSLSRLLIDSDITSGSFVRRNHVDAIWIFRRKCWCRRVYWLRFLKPHFRLTG